MAKNQDKKQNDIVDTLKSRCFDIAQEYIDNMRDPEEIYKNNGLFVDMIKYIYQVYLKDILNNNTNRDANRYDYKLLDNIFNIYTSLVYAYKQNKRCSILEFTLFTNVSRTTLYNAIYNRTQKLTTEEVSIVKKWFTECENTLTNGNSVFEIFLLKSQYRYNDNLQPVPIESQGHVMAINELPNLGINQTKVDQITENNPEIKT